MALATDGTIPIGGQEPPWLSYFRMAVSGPIVTTVFWDQDLGSAGGIPTPTRHLLSGGIIVLGDGEVQGTQVCSHQIAQETGSHQLGLDLETSHPVSQLGVVRPLGSPVSGGFPGNRDSTDEQEMVAILEQLTHQRPA